MLIFLFCNFKITRIRLEYSVYVLVSSFNLGRIRDTAYAHFKATIRRPIGSIKIASLYSNPAN